MSATREAVSNLVGKSSFLICELTEAVVLLAFESWRHTRSLSGVPGACGCTETIRGEEKKGPRNMCLIMVHEKGPDILPA